MLSNDELDVLEEDLKTIWLGIHKEDEIMAGLIKRLAEESITNLKLINFYYNAICARYGVIL